MVQHRDISYIFMLSSWYLGKSHRPKFIQRHVGLHQSDPSYSGSVCTSKIVALREESLSGKKKFMFFFKVVQNGLFSIVFQEFTKNSKKMFHTMSSESMWWKLTNLSLKSSLGAPGICRSGPVKGGQENPKNWHMHRTCITVYICNIVLKYESKVITNYIPVYAQTIIDYCYNIMFITCVFTH